MPTPEDLARLWNGLDDQQREIVASILAVLEALDDADLGWWIWVRDVIESRIPADVAELEALEDMDVWRDAIEGWEDGSFQTND
jgi:hypothetical protein